jgi:hypothetical protein
MSEAFVNLGWGMLFTIVGGAVGVVLIMASTMVIPRFLERLTPNMDEDKEIARGNRAVAEYFGRIVAASIIGVSIVIAAAVLGGIIVALY